MRTLLKLYIFLFLFCIGFSGAFSRVSLAAESLSLSVTPPLYQLNVAPKDNWKSTLKVINNNAFELTVYAEVVNFVPQGEDGQGGFTPRVGGFNPEGPLLADWLQVTEAPIVIAPEQSVEIPIVMMVPENAAPGGHFAAILVGTRPPEATGAAAVRTSQVVTSLFFLRVAGDVREEGSIREFSVSDLFYESPEANFVLRFENIGNVHVQPQGTIEITNMWGRERGIIPINQKSQFGNVLPQSIRKFDFSWKGESSLADIGRYTANVSLTYGQDSRKNVSQETHFWVIPVKGALVTLGILAAFVAFVVFAIRRYVRRALYLAGYEEGTQKVVPEKKQPTTKKNLALPLREGVLDLRTRVVKHDKNISLMASLRHYISTYRLFFSGVVLALIFVATGFYYLSDVLRGQKGYEVTLKRGDADVTLSAEEVIKEQMSDAHPPAEVKPQQTFALTIINESDVIGTGSALALRLEELGYVVDDIAQKNTENESRSVSALVYTASFEAEALKLSSQLGGVAVSLSSATSTDALGIQLFVGNDMVQ